MIIDPLAALIAYLKTDEPLEALVQNRLSSDHQFGTGWDQPSKALVLLLDGGTPDLYQPVQTPRLEARCYGESKVEAMRVYRRLVEISRALHRATVTIPDGTALIYWCQMASGPSLLRDPELVIDYVMVFLTAWVAEQALS